MKYFDIGDDMNRVQFKREADGSFWLEVIIYTSSPYDHDSSTYVKITSEQAKELARWLANQ